jgi:ADP-ribosylglycohydrolase
VLRVSFVVKSKKKEKKNSIKQTKISCDLSHQNHLIVFTCQLIVAKVCREKCTSRKKKEVEKQVFLVWSRKNHESKNKGKVLKQKKRKNQVINKRFRIKREKTSWRHHKSRV